MRGDQMDDTKPDHPALPPGADRRAGFLTWRSAAARTPAGCGRNNEDNFHVVRFGRYLRTVLSSLPAGEAPEEEDPPGYGFAVADGVGGHAAGEVASRRGPRHARSSSPSETPDWILGQ